MAFSISIITMNWRTLFFIFVPLAILTTVVSYEPVSIAVHKIREPYFGYPIKTGPGRYVIRNDAMGDGEFGAKRRNGRSHAGIDIQAPVGTPVYASKSGVAFCGTVPTGYGKYVMIYHPGDFQTFYGHLTNWGIRPIKKVRKGELIGFVGRTGNAANKAVQAHLHFEIREDGEPQNPVDLMR